MYARALTLVRSITHARTLSWMNEWHNRNYACLLQSYGHLCRHCHHFCHWRHCYHPTAPTTSMGPSIGLHLYKRVCPSVGRSVGLICKAFSKTPAGRIVCRVFGPVICSSYESFDESYRRFVTLFHFWRYSSALKHRAVRIGSCFSGGYVEGGEHVLLARNAQPIRCILCMPNDDDVVNDLNCFYFKGRWDDCRWFPRLTNIVQEEIGLRLKKEFSEGSYRGIRRRKRRNPKVFHLHHYRRVNFHCVLLFPLLSFRRLDYFLPAVPLLFHTPSLAQWI